MMRVNTGVYLPQEPLTLPPKSATLSLPMPAAPFEIPAAHQAPDFLPQPAKESHSPEQNTQWWANWPVISTLLEKSWFPFSAPHHHKKLPSNFRLFDVLVEVAEELSLTGFNPEQLSLAEHPVIQQLESLLREQLFVSLQEHLETPYSSDANFVSLREFILNNRLAVYHPKYPERDLLERIKLAVAASTGAAKERYLREQHQTEQLYTQFAQDMRAEGLAANWEMATVGEFLSDKVRRQFNLPDKQVIFLGPKHANSLPLNPEVYPEGMSYINLYQLVYVPLETPAEGLMLMLTDQYYSDLSLATHQDILDFWQNQPETDNKAYNEEMLMQLLILLPEETRMSPAYQLFAEIAEKFHPRGSEYHLRQQKSLANLANSQETIRLGATFLTRALMTEYALLLEYPQAIEAVSTRLQFALELVAHPLLSLESFQPQAMWEAYYQHYIQPVHEKYKKSPPDQAEMTLRLKMLQTKRDILDRDLTQTEQGQRQAAVQQLIQAYPQFLTNVISKSMCMTGSFGALAKTQEAFNLSLAKGFLDGKLPTHADLVQLIGQERADQWHLGVCINKGCRMGGIEQMVGECEVCWDCEMRSQLGMLISPSEEQGDDPWKNWTQTDLQTSQQGVELFQRLWPTVTADVLPGFIISDQVLKYSRPGSAIRTH